LNQHAIRRIPEPSNSDVKNAQIVAELQPRVEIPRPRRIPNEYRIDLSFQEAIKESLKEENIKAQ